MAEVRLVDLEIIKRYSLAVRREKAPAEELLAALDASRAAVVAAMGDTSSSSKGRRPRAKTDTPPAEATPDPLADHDVLDRFDHVDHLDQFEDDEQVAS